MTNKIIPAILLIFISLPAFSFGNPYHQPQFPHLGRTDQRLRYLYTDEVGELP